MRSKGVVLICAPSQAQTWSAVLVMGALCMLARTSEAAEVNPGQACAPVPGSTYWSADELVYAQNLRYMVGKDVVLPTAPGALSIKYERCLREMDDATAFNAHQVMQTYESMSGWTKMTTKLGAMAMGWLVPADAGLGGWLSKKAFSSGSSGLARQINGGAETEIEGLMTNMLLQEAKSNPNAGPQEILAIVDRIKTKIKSDIGYTKLDTATLRLLDSAAIVAAKRTVEIRRQGQNVTTVQEPNKDTLGRARIKQFESEMRVRAKRVVDAQTSIGAAAEGAGKHLQASGPERADWQNLRDKRMGLAKQLGEEQADAALASASKDAAAVQNLATSMGLSTSEAQMLADDAQRRLSLKQLSAKVKTTNQVVSEMATLAGNVGWNEGAASFAAAAQAAINFGSMVDLLAGMVGPPSPLQGLQMANSMFALAGGLSGAFGGGSKSADDGLGKAIRQILAGLQSINEQLALMRKEQREHFAYAERNLEVLVELAASEQWSGLDACRSAVSQLAALTADTGITDLRTALGLPNYPDADARTCAAWLMEPTVNPIKFDGKDVSPVYKQLVSVATTIAASHGPAVAGLKNQNFAEAEVAYPRLRSLVNDDEAVKLLEPRVRWSGPVAFDVADIGPRLREAGRVVGQDWAVRDLTRQMLSTPTVLQSAQAAVMLRAAAGMLLQDYPGVASQDQSDRKHVNYRNNVLGTQFAISLVALAQENLMSGALLAEHIDVLLEEGDQREALASLVTCRAHDSMAACLMRANLPELPVISGCARAGGEPAEKCLPCPQPPDPAGTTLCSRFGKQAFDDRLAVARASVFAFPTLRQNVLGARMWRLAGRAQHHEQWMPRYAWAMGYVEADGKDQSTQARTQAQDLGLFALRQLFPTMAIRTLGEARPDDAPIDGYLTTGTYFSRLAGQCNGISERAQLGISACSDGQCAFVVDKTEQGRLRLKNAVKNAWREPGERSNNNACVMATLPSSRVFGEGLLWQTEGAGRLRAVVDRLAAMLAFERAYDQLDEPAQKWRLLEAREAQMQLQTTLDIEGGIHVH
jgi:hypothetical protein